MIKPVPLPEPEPCDCPSQPAPTAELELVKNLVIPTANAAFVKLMGDELPDDAPAYVLVIESANGLPKRVPPKVSTVHAQGAIQ